MTVDANMDDEKPTIVCRCVGCSTLVSVEKEQIAEIQSLRLTGFRPIACNSCRSVVSDAERVSPTIVGDEFKFVYVLGEMNRRYAQDDDADSRREYVRYMRILRRVVSESSVIKMTLDIEGFSRSMGTTISNHFTAWAQDGGGCE